MTAIFANRINAYVLILAGLYGYFYILTYAGKNAPTALIPAAFGAILLLLGIFWNNAPKIIAHIAVTLTAVLLLVLIKQFFGIPTWSPKKYLFLACIISNAVALYAFVKSFIDARKAR